MPFAPFVLIAALLTQVPSAPRQGYPPPPKQPPRTAPKKPAVPATTLIDSAAASKQGLAVMATPRDFSAAWFASRYGIAAPPLETMRLANPVASADIYSLKPAADDAPRLWSGLEADLAPNQALVEKHGIIGLIVSTDPGLRRKVVALIKPTKQAPAKSDVGWLEAEMPREIPGLVFVYARFLAALPELEERVNGLGIRAVYQASYSLPRALGPKGLAQTDFWVARDASRLADLSRSLDSRKTGEQTIMSGKGVAVVVSTRTNQATQILVDWLKQKGYRLESRVATFAETSR